MKKAVVILLLLASSICHAQKAKIVFNSSIAKWVSRIKHQDPYAITFGRTVFVSCDKKDFYSKPWWVKHELAHVAQYQKLGVTHFLSLYIFYSIFNHRTQNPFEAEAEAAELAAEASNF